MPSCPPLPGCPPLPVCPHALHYLYALMPSIAWMPSCPPLPGCPHALLQGKLHSTPMPPARSRHACQPTVKLYVLPLVWIFLWERGSTGAHGGRSWNLPCPSHEAASFPPVAARQIPVADPASSPRYGPPYSIVQCNTGFHTASYNVTRASIQHRTM